MRKKKQSNRNIQAFSLLVRGVLHAIPFNAALAFLLGLDFIYSQVPQALVLTWLFAIISLSIIRWVSCFVLLKYEYFKTHYSVSFALFYFFTFLMGASWAGSYFVFLPYLSAGYEGIFIVVLGGLAAGAMASMSISVSVYSVYILSMFVPLIAYNFYLAGFDKTILAIMYLLFLTILFLNAKANARLLLMTSKLSKEKDKLIDELKETNLRLEQSIEEVRAMSITDSLTDLFNRRYFDMVFSKELSRAKRGGYTVNLIFMDIDNFKSVNDTYGHPAGDELLIYLADTLRKIIRRASDTLFRLGGDEFAAIVSMPAADVPPFCAIVQDAFNKSNKYEQTSLSIGIISMPPTQLFDYDSIITEADNLLYQAKKSGKNKIVSKILG